MKNKTTKKKTFSRLENYLVLRYSFIKSHSLSCKLPIYFTNVAGVMSLTPSFSFMWLWAWELSWRQCLWGLGGEHHFVCLKILVLQQGCSSKEQTWALSLYVMTDAYGSMRFSAIFSASLLFNLLHSGAIPLVAVKTRGLNEDFLVSIILWLYLSFSFSCCW